jgi:peptide/nickel transport system permease protein
MISLILRKIMYGFAVVLGVIIISFCINVLLPGDPARLLLGERADESAVLTLRTQMGLDKPLPVQLGTYILKVMRGDFGRSFATNREVLPLLLERLPATALLAIVSILLASLLGVVIGIISALRHGTWLDSFMMSIALLGISLPSFVVGLLVAVVFGIVFDFFPISGYVNRGWEHIVLPAFTLGIRPLSVIARVMRGSMLEVLQSDYIRTARAKGLSERSVIVRHALRNSLTPVITTVSTWFASLLAGAIFVEYIFNWPGIGSVTISAIEQLDFPVIQGSVLIISVLFVMVNVAADILYSLADPRISIQ